MPPGDRAPGRSDEERKFLAGAVVLVVLVAAVLAGAFLLNRDGEDEVATGDTTTTEAPTTTEDPTTTTTAPAVEINGIWPVWDEESFESATHNERYSDPRATAEDFAREYLGMREPVVDELREEEPRAVEVDVRPNPDAGTVTTLDLRQLGNRDDSPWTVVAAQSEQIIVDEPEVLEEVTSPVHVSGRALAFEGHVSVEVRQGGMEFGDRPLGEGFVTGSGAPPPGPFEGDIEFDEPSMEKGAIVFFEPSAEDGSTLSATVIQVRFPG